MPHAPENLFGEAGPAPRKRWRCLPCPGRYPAARVPIAMPPPSKRPRSWKVVDSFAGGGGASNGIELALKILAGMGLLPQSHSLKVDYAVNHDDAALCMHEANHPETIHLPANVWQVSMRETLGDYLFGLLWLSPDCRDHSAAKGGPITSRAVRDLAWVAIKWLKELPDWQRPWVICLENVSAFAKWSPLIERADGKGLERDPDRLGWTFHQFVHALASYGYSVGWMEVVACEYGDPTIRKRLKLVARRNHAGDGFRGQRLGEPFATVARARDVHGLVVPHLMTMRNSGSPTAPADEPARTIMAGGANQFAIEAAIVPSIVGVGGRMGQSAPRSVGKPWQSTTTKPDSAICAAMVAPFVSRGQHGGGNRPATDPVHTIAASDGDQNQVAAVYIAQHNNDSRRTTGVNPGRSAKHPMSTLTVEGAQQQVVAASMLSLKGSDRRDGSCEDAHPAVCAGGQHSALVTLPLMTAYYSTGGQHARVDDPSLAVPTKARFGLTQVAVAAPPLTEAQWARARQVAEFLRRHGCWDGGEIVTLSIRGIAYVIVDIGMRMLTPRELARAQGFPDSYKLDPIFKGKPLSETEQRHKIGNSVCEKPAAAVIVANYRPPMDWCEAEFLEAAE